MARLREDEIRRLLDYLRGQIAAATSLLWLEDELRGDEGGEFLREPEILTYFPATTSVFLAGNMIWRMRFIPHALLRMTQRGVGSLELVSLFTRFVEFCQNSNQIIHIGAYQIVGKSQTSAKVLTLRVDVDTIEDESGTAHVVTVFYWRGDGFETIEIELN